ncbi:MAG: NAD(P)H-dependent oxidoreductase subunit E, partial [Anaerolineaceae bacterium]|nr:NAD(P)H-dependent oxidoreductase subunit E [Anaerolineaceae bacterium]
MTDLDLSPLVAQVETLSWQGRTALLPALHIAQELFGCVPEAAALEIGRGLGVPLAEVFGVIDFYTLFTREPVAEKVIHVCNDPACAMAGADAMMKRIVLRQTLSPGGGGTGSQISFEQSPCLG